MAILWQKTSEARWSPTTLHGAACLLGDSIEHMEDASPDVSRHHTLILPSSGENANTTWLLVTPPASAALLNGRPLKTGIRVLADRDAIRLPGGRTRYFSTEALARVETFRDQEPVSCARCKLPLTAGDDAVACPNCGIWHHAPTDGESCWTYAETCAALCGQATDLEAGYRWSPAGL
jgi:hypothetical protein